MNGLTDIMNDSKDIPPTAPPAATDSAPPSPTPSSPSPTPPSPTDVSTARRGSPSVLSKTGSFDEESWTDALWVKADPIDISKEERAEAKRKLAGAIVHRIKDKGECRLRAFGAHACFKTDFCLVMARSTLAGYGYDLYWFCCFIDSKMGNETMTGLGYITAIARADS